MSREDVGRLMHGRIIEVLNLRRESVKSFCQATEITQGFFCNWASGRGLPSVLTLMKVADYLDISIDYLTGRKDLRW